MINPSKTDVCFECKALKAQLDILINKEQELGQKIADISIKSIWYEAKLAQAMELAIDLAQRLKLRMKSDTEAWPGDRSVFLYLDKLQESLYRKSFNCETK